MVRKSVFGGHTKVNHSVVVVVIKHLSQSVVDYIISKHS